MQVTVSAKGRQPYRQVITAGPHSFFSDVPPEKGGQDTAPCPHQLLLGAWGACIAMTIQMYANRKAWPLTDVSVTMSEETRDNKPFISKRIQIEGNLTPEQVDRLKAIGEKCPINRLITGEKVVETEVNSE